MRTVRQPRVVGEIVAGIVLGPALMGQLQLYKQIAKEVCNRDVSTTTAKP